MGARQRKSKSTPTTHVFEFGAQPSPPELSPQCNQLWTSPSFEFGTPTVNGTGRMDDGAAAEGGGDPPQVPTKRMPLATAPDRVIEVILTHASERHMLMAAGSCTTFRRAMEAAVVEVVRVGYPNLFQGADSLEDVWKKWTMVIQLSCYYTFNDLKYKSKKVTTDGGLDDNKDSTDLAWFESISKSAPPSVLDQLHRNMVQSTEELAQLAANQSCEGGNCSSSMAEGSDEMAAGSITVGEDLG